MWWRTILIMTLYSLAHTAMGADQGDFWSREVEPIEMEEADAKKPRKRLPRRIETSFKQHAMGLGLHLPDIFPFEYDFRFHRQFSWHVSFVPPLPFRIRVELPQDRISSKQGVIIEHPEIDINLKSIYGPLYSTALRWSPTGPTGFYTRFGISYRSLRLKGRAQAPLILNASGVEITTLTEFGLNVDAETSAWLGRVDIGWRWHVGASSYLDWSIVGIAAPYQSRNRADVEAYIQAPGGNDNIEGALALLKEEKEKELRSKALDEMRPATSRILPMLGLTFGFLF